ncbi:histidinol-phosphate phosphatase [Ornithinimicrobium cerasi]|uniref:Histidinol-phosphate phosphatase n=2 Tax=Ornithinimicrobium cerasi TaxID=2248773 RepID=A0A285VSL8_9MICO|nr:histidinol-phosphate phosphatase [Ornithinimicrobium cerasi]
MRVGGYGERMASYDDDLRLAHVLADSIERTAVELFASPGLEVSVADDGSLTTQAAQRLEELLRHQLQRTRPRDRVEGRILGATGHGDRRWVVDALDGTANYVRGVPVWGTLLSLVVEDEPVLGLVAAPSLARRWWAGRGSGAWTGRTLSRARQVRVSRTAVLEHASVSADDVASWLFGPHGQGFAQLTDRTWRTRAYGDFWSHALVAEGAVDVGLGAYLDTYQTSTLTALVHEAGGRVSDPWGAPVSGREPTAGSPVVVTNGGLHDAVLAALSPGELAEG